ncbi:hypothetical protein LCGC14_2782810 [marine sediment metagenome]|uniref:PD-(D/E)XK endonuclease-like domain-containing protein n=1 Tax=marine sediment metagenome TaxID=412755 RepID=A0A0F8ZEX4_9ZZZZ
MKTTPKRKEWEKDYSTQVVYLEEIKQSKATLRFGKNYIKNSEVSGQIYCERQVELKYIDGEVETEQLIVGRESHEVVVKDSNEGLFLNTLGFDTSSLLYSIIIAPLLIEKESPLLNKIPTMIYKKTEVYKLGYPTSFNDIANNNINAYVYEFELDIAKKNVNWALQYWKEEREAELTKNINKCRSCNYISGCERKNTISIQS